MFAHHFSGGGAEGAVGADEAVNEVEIRLQLMATGNVNAVQLRRIAAAQPQLAPHVGVHHQFLHPPGEELAVVVVVVDDESRDLGDDVVGVDDSQDLGPQLLEVAPEAPVPDARPREGDDGDERRVGEGLLDVVGGERGQRRP